MGRRSSGGGRSYSTGSSFPKFRSSIKKSSPKPNKDEKAPPPAKVETTTIGGSRSSGSFFSNGFGFGYGHAMGQRFFEGIFGPRTIRQEVVAAENVKEVATLYNPNDDYEKHFSISYDAFQDCLNVEGNNLKKCHLFMDSLFECRKNSSSFNF